MTSVCALDLGFGWTKGIFENRTYIQPTIFGESKPLFDNSIKPDDFIFNDQYFVGKLASRQSDIKYFSMNNNKAESFTSDVVLQTALGYLIGNNTANIVSGLPVKFYFKQKEKFEATVSQINDIERYRIKKGNMRPIYVSPRLNEIKTVPQGQAIAMDYLLKENGNIDKVNEARKKILVVDLGFYTLNLLGLSKLEIMKESTSLLLGVDNAYKLIEQQFQKMFGWSPARYELDQYIISTTFEGNNIKPLIDQAFRSLARQIQNEIESMNIKFDLYLIAGGAAQFIFDYLELENKILLDQMSQSRGYRKIGARIWKS